MFARAGSVASATTQPDLTILDKLNDRLKIRQAAGNFTALADMTRPKFIWGGRNMLWIMHDGAGKPMFAMNRAYALQIGRQQPACYLLESHDYYWDDPDGPTLIYTRFVDEHPLVVARDPSRGVIYQARWDSAPQSGSGAITQTRNIFLLCDGEHRWHLLGEGPIGSGGQCGGDEQINDAVEADSRWTGNPAHPVELSFTMLTTDLWDYDGENFHESMTVRRRMAPGPVDSSGYAKPEMAVDMSPGPFKRGGPYYLIASKGELLDSFVRRLCHQDLSGVQSEAKKRTIVESTEASLRKTNPGLSTEIAKGEKIILPEKTYGSSDDRMEW